MYFNLSKKSKYAISALLELALVGDAMPLNARKLAMRYNLPSRFLEIILNELKQGGFVQSVRGKAGGYILARPSGHISLAQVLGFLEGGNADALLANGSSMSGFLALEQLIGQTNQAVSELFGCCTLAQLAQQELKCRSTSESNYVI